MQLKLKTAVKSNTLAVNYGMQIYNNYMAFQMVHYGIASFLNQKTKKTAQSGGKVIIFVSHWRAV